MSPSVGGWWRRLLISGFALTLLATLGVSYEQIGRWQDSQHRFRVGRAVDIGGRTLNIDCAGAGAPAVILEAGGGGHGGYGWKTVQSGIAQFTTVCWYDRAGEGWSDSAPIARSSASVVHDLHELLRRAPLEGPYVLVGHSIGGEYVRVFAAQYPSEVAGVVLVDSTHPDQDEPLFLRSRINQVPIFVRRLLCAAVPIAERFGLVRLLMIKLSAETPPPVSSQQNAAAMHVMHNQRVKAFETETAQECAATAGGSILPEKGSGNPELDAAARNSGSLGDRPLVVLTAGRYWKPDDPVAAQQAAAFHDIWVYQLQAELARLSTRGKQIVVDGSDHGIPQQAPGAVVEAVHEVVVEVQKSAEK